MTTIFSFEFSVECCAWKRVLVEECKNDNIVFQNSLVALVQTCRYTIIYKESLQSIDLEINMYKKKKPSITRNMVAQFCER